MKTGDLVSSNSVNDEGMYDHNSGMYVSEFSVGLVLDVEIIEGMTYGHVLVGDKCMLFLSYQLELIR